MNFRIKTLLAATGCAALCLQALAAVDLDGVAFTESAQVAGRNLRLNGAGISFRLVFKVYAMGLYLPEPRETAQEVLALAGPRRLLITMLRDVSGAEFEQGVMRSVAADAPPLPARITQAMLQLSRAIASQPQGLRRGDTLTLDWVPGTGTVVELNKRPLTEPIPDIAFHNALLNIWLGDKPTDLALKTRLLGHPAPLRTAMY